MNDALKTSRSAFIVPRSSFIVQERGFTLLEILIVVFLLGVMLAFAIPRTNLTVTLSSSGRSLVSTVRAAFAAASASQRTHRLHIDVSRGVYWVTSLDREKDKDKEEEKPSADPSVAQRVTLPAWIKFREVTTFLQGAVTGGEVFIQFFPVGRTEPATIRLMDDEQNVLTLTLNPLTGSLSVSDRVEPVRNAPIPERLRPYLTPIPAAPPTALPPPGMPPGGMLR